MSTEDMSECKMPLGIWQPSTMNPLSSTLSANGAGRILRAVSLGALDVAALLLTDAGPEPVDTGSSLAEIIFKSFRHLTHAGNVQKA